jgi:hypothetical protein
VRIYARLAGDDPAERAVLRRQGFTWDCGTLSRVCLHVEAAPLLRELVARDYRLVPHLDRRVELSLLRSLGLTGAELVFYRTQTDAGGRVTLAPIYPFE